jgi:hypothetical protein
VTIKLYFVRSGSKADLTPSLGHVRFAPESAFNPFAALVATITNMTTQTPFSVQEISVGLQAIRLARLANLLIAGGLLEKGAPVVKDHWRRQPVKRTRF